MAQMKVLGISAYMNALREAYDNAESEVEKAVYEGAKIIADECKRGIESIPIDARKGTSDNKVRGITEDQKWGLEDSFGLARIKDENGYINTKAGFSGYNTYRTAKYPQGQPNVLIARSVESGTSFREKFPFMRKAVNNSKKKAIYAMDKYITDSLKGQGF